MTGYLHRGYAESLSEFGTPRELPACGAWILERPISGSPYHDAMGCYPLFLCRDWARLYMDLKNIDDLVSLVLVTDPFGDYDISYLNKNFDVVIPFKEHLVTDLTQPMNSIVSENHRYWARKSLKELSVELCDKPMQQMDEWMRIYDTLIQRHNIKGIQAFSREAFERQFQLPGFLMFRAMYGDETVGLQTYFVHGDIGYGHLMAMSETGYRMRTAYAMTWSSFQYLADKLKWIDVGAVPGTGSKESEGLLAFKRGWTTGSRTAYLCGRILDKSKYEEIVNSKGMEPNNYFPSYRKDEFE